MSEADWLKLLIPAGASLMGGVIGAYVGGWVALARYKSEKAHDRLLEWYAQAAHACLVLLGVCDEALKFLESSAAVMEASARAEMGSRIDAASLVLESGALFAMPHTLATIRSVERQIESVWGLAKLVDEATDEDSIATLEKLADLLIEAHTEIVRDGREELYGRRGRVPGALLRASGWAK